MIQRQKFFMNKKDRCKPTHAYNMTQLTRTARVQTLRHTATITYFIHIVYELVLILAVDYKQ